jgi:hypothetical protein
VETGHEPVKTGKPAIFKPTGLMLTPGFFLMRSFNIFFVKRDH